jgi:hypothetical protein
VGGSERYGALRGRAPHEGVAEKKIGLAHFLWSEGETSPLKIDFDFDLSFDFDFDFKDFKDFKDFDFPRNFNVTSLENPKSNQ